MAKILQATCDATGKVFFGSILIPEAIVLSEGNAASQGLLFFDKDQVFYLPSSATDILSTLEKTSGALEKTVDALEKIAETLTSIGSGMTGATTAPPGTLAGDVIQINLLASQIDSFRTQLDTLSEGLK